MDAIAFHPLSKFGSHEEALIKLRHKPSFLYKYARDAVHGRWPEAEDTIKKEPEYACYYAINVLKDRWPEAEPIMRKNLGAYHIYKNAMLSRFGIRIL